MKKKLIVDILLFIFMILEYSRVFIDPLYHEIFGIVLVALMIIHLYLNRNYLKNIFKGKYNATRIIMLIVNILFILAFILASVFGILSSDDLLDFLNIRNPLIVKLHKSISYISLILMGIHLGINLNTMVIGLKKKIKNKMLLCFVGSLIVLYGIYSFLKLDILKHITGFYEFSPVEGTLFINILRYTSISLGISIITYNIYNLIKQQRLQTKKDKKKGE